jgi:transposase
MHEIASSITERVDDIPLLLAQMQRRHLPALIDQHCPVHGNWHGLSLGWVTTIGLSSLLSRGDHRVVHVEPWGGARLWTLRTATGHGLERRDCTDDRLAIVLRRLRDDTRWSELASPLNQHTVRVYDLVTDRVYVESPSARAYVSVTEDGWLQLGPSNSILKFF